MTTTLSIPHAQPLSSAPRLHRQRQVVVLGSTGSIGVNTLHVIDHLNRHASEDSTIDQYQVVGLAAGRGGRTLIEQAKKFHVPVIAVADQQHAAEIARELPEVEVLVGADSALQLVQRVQASDLVAAVVGSAGLPATLEAARKGWMIHLANKETLVAAGALVTPIVREKGTRLLPVDSEHSAIFQCLEGSNYRTHPQAIKRIVLTASGGPFRTKSKKEIHEATVEQALKHPTWNMGPKITIDSATMMNKALEIIEAHWLFDLPAEKISVIIHPQSVAHSFVEFADHSVLAQLGAPDMKTPIQYALTYPHRQTGSSVPMDWSKLSKLDFEPPDHDRFPSLKLAYEVIEAGGTAGAIFNAANEAAVAAFLEQKIRFGRITELVAQALSAVATQPLDCLQTALQADHAAREYVRRSL